MIWLVLRLKGLIPAAESVYTAALWPLWLVGPLTVLVLNVIYCFEDFCPPRRSIPLILIPLPPIGYGPVITFLSFIYSISINVTVGISSIQDRRQHLYVLAFAISYRTVGNAVKPLTIEKYDERWKTGWEVGNGRLLYIVMGGEVGLNGLVNRSWLLKKVSMAFILLWFVQPIVPADESIHTAAL